MTLRYGYGPRSRRSPQSLGEPYTPPAGTAPTITSTAATTAITGSAYHYDADDTATATGDAPITWSKITGPAGLSINSSSGLITYTPGSDGDVSVTIRATNAYGTDDQSWTISAGTVPVITSTAATTAITGSAYHYDGDDTATATGTATITWSKITGPAGLSINSSSGVVSYTPGADGNYAVTIRATNTWGYDEESWTIAAGTVPTITSTGATSGTEGVAYSYDADDTATATGTATITWSKITGPAEFSINSSSGLVSWTPASSGTIPITIRATNTWGTDDESFDVVVAAASTDTIGVSTLSTSNYWKTATNTGILGSATMTAHVVARLDARTTTTQQLCGHGDRSSAGGWGIETTTVSGGAAIRAYIVNGSGTVVTSNAYPWSSEDDDKVHVIGFTLSSNVLRFYVDGVRVGSTTAATGYTTPSSSLATSLGSRDGGTSPTVDYTIIGVVGASSTALTDQEMLDYADDVMALSEPYPTAYASGTTCRWIGSDADTLPSTWSAATGSANLSKQGTGGTQEDFTADNYGLKTWGCVGAMSTTNYWATAADAVPKGGTAFSCGVVLSHTAQVSGTGYCVAHYDGTASNGGWGFQTETSGSDTTLRFFIINGSATAVFSSTFTLTAANYGKVYTATGLYNGSQCRLFVDGSSVGGTSTSGYTTPNSSVKTTIGCLSGGSSADTTVRVFSVQSANASMSTTNISDWHAACQQYISMRDLNGVTDEANWDGDTGYTLPTNWADTVGSINITKQGTGGTGTAVSPIWRT